MLSTSTILRHKTEVDQSTPTPFNVYSAARNNLENALTGERLLTGLEGTGTLVINSGQICLKSECTCLNSPDNSKTCKMNEYCLDALGNLLCLKPTHLQVECDNSDGCYYSQEMNQNLKEPAFVSENGFYNLEVAQTVICAKNETPYKRRDSNIVCFEKKKCEDQECSCFNEDFAIRVNQKVKRYRDKKGGEAESTEQSLINTVADSLLMESLVDVQTSIDHIGFEKKCPPKNFCFLVFNGQSFDNQVGCAAQEIKPEETCKHPDGCECEHQPEGSNIGTLRIKCLPNNKCKFFNDQGPFLACQNKIKENDVCNADFCACSVKGLNDQKSIASCIEGQTCFNKDGVASCQKIIHEAEYCYLKTCSCLRESKRANNAPISDWIQSVANCQTTQSCFVIQDKETCVNTIEPGEVCTLDKCYGEPTSPTQKEAFACPRNYKYIVTNGVQGCAEPERESIIIDEGLQKQGDKKLVNQEEQITHGSTNVDLQTNLHQPVEIPIQEDKKPIDRPTSIDHSKTEDKPKKQEPPQIFTITNEKSKDKYLCQHENGCSCVLKTRTIHKTSECLPLQICGIDDEVPACLFPTNNLYIRPNDYCIKKNGKCICEVLYGKSVLTKECSAGEQCNFKKDKLSCNSVGICLDCHTKSECVCNFLNIKKSATETVCHYGKYLNTFEKKCPSSGIHIDNAKLKIKVNELIKQKRYSFEYNSQKRITFGEGRYGISPN